MGSGSGNRGFIINEGYNWFIDNKEEVIKEWGFIYKYTINR